MTITNTDNFTDDASGFVHSTFMASLGDDFTSFVDVIKSFSTDEAYGSVASPGMSADMVEIISKKPGEDSPLPAFYSMRNCRDTTIGGNDAVNSYYQYNEHDDLMHPFTYAMSTTPADVDTIEVAGSGGVSGMGRVYYETIELHQQVMWLGWGTALFNNLTNFYSSLFDSDLATLMNKGPSGSSMDHIGYMLGRTAIRVVIMPTIPLLFINKLLNKLLYTPVTKYYDFRSQMPLYYRFVQTMLVNLAVNMNIMDGGSSIPTKDTELQASTAASNTTAASSESGEGATVTDLYSGASTDNTASGTNKGLPDLFYTYQLDVYRIMLKRYFYETGDSSIVNDDTASNDTALKAQAGADASDAQTTTLTNATVVDMGYKTFSDGIFNAFSYALTGTIYDCQMFVGFRIERGVDTTESMQSQTGPSSIKSTINSKMQAARDTMFTAENGNLVGGTLGAAVDKFMGGLKSFVHGTESIVGLDGLAEAVVGAGMVDIPDIWMDSSFSKNYSFTLQLRTPYGDPVSILQSLYFPLCMILAGSMPRAIGKNSYTSPFLCRAYCKGFFAVPLGIIDSVNIVRGGDVHGWSISRLPTAIDLSFTIKDLSPVMYMAMGDNGGVLDQIIGINTPFSEYLMTLSGMGLRDRILPLRNMKRKAKILVNSLLTTKLNPFYWGMEMGDKPVVHWITDVLPTTALPGN